MPANIALIKYMGKRANNIPNNLSVSYTSFKFLTTVTLQLSDSSNDRFVTDSYFNAEEQQRFLSHLALVKNFFKFNQGFLVRSINNFPHGCGVASSASSFAALTKAAATAISCIRGSHIPDEDTLAMLSRQGSGSSCRSFFAPFALWDTQGVYPLDINTDIEIVHDVIVVDSSKKSISSSAAHQRVPSSALFIGREARVIDRYHDVVKGFQKNNWRLLFDVVWAEFWDMHALFHTSMPSFGYITPKTMQVLSSVTRCWDNFGDGPIATIDAGPNVHLLFRKDQELLRKEMLELLSEEYTIL